jgi:prophage antirepressor-like protein
MNTSITPFLFGESIIRTIIREDQPWFLAKDVCEVLSISNNRDAVSSLDDDEKITVANPDGNPRAGIPHEMTYVSESGLYALIFKSRKTEAKIFRKWVTSEVLPSIRKKGFYSHRTDQVLSFIRELLAMGFTPKDASILARGEFPPLTRKEQRMQELEQQNTEAKDDPEALLFLSIMAPGIEYRVNDFYTALPPGHRILAIKTVKGRTTAIGMVMERLVRMGKLRRINARLATFALASDKIVPMER